MIGTVRKFEVKNLKINTYKWNLAIEKEVLSNCKYGLFALPREESLSYRGGGKLFVYINRPRILTNDFGIASQLSEDGVKLNFITFDATSIKNVFTVTSRDSVNHNFQAPQAVFTRSLH